MKTRSLLSALTSSALLALTTAVPAMGATLYSGTGVPADAGFTYQAVRVVPGLPPTLAPFAAVQTPLTPGVRLDTTSDNAGYAGYALQLPTGALDRAAGYRLSFTVALDRELNTNTPRAGFSLLALSSDTAGIELAFNAGRVFAQSAAFNSTATSADLPSPTALTTYHLTVDATTYTLSTDAGPLLSGPLVPTYTPTPGPFSAVYAGHDFLFLGDNTSQASADFRLTNVTLVPEPTSAALLTAPLLLLAARRRH